MEPIKFTPEFKIGQDVYHKADSDKGIVVDIGYSVLTGLIIYLVAFGRTGLDQVDCYAHELSENKIVF